MARPALGAAVFDAIARSTWDPPRAAAAGSAGAKRDASAFERRGVSLAALSELADAARGWPSLRRVLRTGGGCCAVRR